LSVDDDLLGFDVDRGASGSGCALARPAKPPRFETPLVDMDGQYVTASGIVTPCRPVGCDQRRSAPAV